MDEALLHEEDEIQHKTKFFCCKMDNDYLIQFLCKMSCDKLLELIDGINRFSSKKYDIFMIGDIKDLLISYTENYILSYLTLKLFKNNSLNIIFSDSYILSNILDSPLPNNFDIVTFFTEEFPDTNSIFERLEEKVSVDINEVIEDLAATICKEPALKLTTENICRYVVCSIKLNFIIEKMNVSAEINNRSGKLEFNEQQEKELKSITISIPIKELKYIYLNQFFDKKYQKINGQLALKSYSNKVAMLNETYIPFMIKYTWNLLNIIGPRIILNKSIINIILTGMFPSPISENSSNNLPDRNKFYIDYICFDDINLNSSDYFNLQTGILKFYRNSFSIRDIARKGIESYRKINKIKSRKYINEMTLYIEECIYTSTFLCEGGQIDTLEATRQIFKDRNLTNYDSNYHTIWRFLKTFQPLQRISDSICKKLNYTYDVNKIPASYVNDIYLKYNFFNSNKKSTIINKSLNYDDFKEYILSFINSIENSSLDERMKIYKLNSLERSYCFNFICTLCKYINSNRKHNELSLDKKNSFVDTISVLGKVPLITYRKELMKSYLKDFKQDNLNSNDIIANVLQINECINYAMLFTLNIISNVDYHILTNSLKSFRLPEKFQIVDEPKNLSERWYKKVVRSIFDKLENLGEDDTLDV